MALTPNPSPNGRGETKFDNGLSMPFPEAGLERINQPLPDIRSSYQPIDQHVNAVKIFALIIIRSRKIDLLSFAEQSREAALHQAHQVRSYEMTRRRRDRGARRLTVSSSLILRTITAYCGYLS